MSTKFHYVYRITNSVENKHYYGVRSSVLPPKEDLGFKYFSSSSDEQFIIEQKEHPEHFKYKVVREFETREEANEFEATLHKKFDVSKNERFYNIASHFNSTFCVHGRISVIDPTTGESMSVEKGDPRFVSGELVHPMKGKVVVTDEIGDICVVSVEEAHNYTYLNSGICVMKEVSSGKTVRVSVNDPRIETGELVGSTKGMCAMKEVSTGNIVSVSVDDPRIQTGELVGTTHGMVSVYDEDGNSVLVPKDHPKFLDGTYKGVLFGKVNVKDKNGVFHQLDKDDPRIGTEFEYFGSGMVPVYDDTGVGRYLPLDHPKYISGEWKHCGTGMCTMKNVNTGENEYVSVDDERIKNGELVSLFIGKVSVKDKDGNTFQVDKDDPRYLSGELVGVNTGMVTVRDNEIGKNVKITIEEYESNKDRYEGLLKGKHIYKDVSTGESVLTTKDDPRVISGELISVMCGTRTVKNVATGEIIKVPVDDPRVKTGELVSITLGKVTVRNKETGETKQLDKDDPRIGKEFEHMFVGKVVCRNKAGERRSLSNESDEYKSGEWFSISSGIYEVFNENDESMYIAYGNLKEWCEENGVPYSIKGHRSENRLYENSHKKAGTVAYLIKRGYYKYKGWYTVKRTDL